MTWHLLEKEIAMPLCRRDRKLNRTAARQSLRSLQALRTHSSGSAPQWTGLAMLLAQCAGLACHHHNRRQGSLTASPVSFKTAVSNETTASGSHAKCCPPSYVVHCYPALPFLWQPRATGTLSSTSAQPVIKRKPELW